MKSIDIPRQLVLAECLQNDVLISLSLKQPKLQGQLHPPNMFDNVSKLRCYIPDQSQDPSITTNCFPLDFTKKFMLIKLNSLAISDIPLTCHLYNLYARLVELFNTGKLDDIILCEYEAEIMSQILLKVNHETLNRLDEQILEGIIEGSALLTTIGVWIYHEAEQFIKKHEIAFTLSFVALEGRRKAFTGIVHQQKNHEGQILYANKIHDYSNIVEIQKPKGYMEIKVQDPYSMRCSPHVSGVCYDLLIDLKQQLPEFINYPHQKYIYVKGRKLPNLLMNSDSLSLKIDYLKCSIQEIGAQIFLRSQRILNSYLGKNHLPANKKHLYDQLMVMLSRAIHLTNQNKILSQMANADTMNIKDYQNDVYSQVGNYFNKCRQMMDNMYYLITLEILSACASIAEKHEEDYISQMFNHPTMKQSFKYFQENIDVNQRKKALRTIRKWKP